MPRIRVKSSRLGADREADDAGGRPLVDICDDLRLPIPFSCRSASCATCQVFVREGSELLEPAEADELDLLEFIRAPSECRLACQVRVREGKGTVVLEPA